MHSQSTTTLLPPTIEGSSKHQESSIHGAPVAASRASRRASLALRSLPRPHPLRLPLLAALLFAAAAAVAAPADESEGRLILDARYRFEQVEQDGPLKHASAHTLRTRLGYQTATWHGLSGLAEVDDVRSLGAEHYNDTRNGKSAYATVADPEGIAVNQLLVRGRFAKGSATVGRQRINLDNQRFVGGVGWRQNEQTYDGGVIEFKPTSASTVTYGYIDNIDTVFGPDSPATPGRTAPADIEGHSHLLNARYVFGTSLTATAYHYRLGLDNIGVTAAAPLGTLSSKTTGLRLQGVLGGTTYVVEHARQSSLADNPWDLDSRYRLIEVGQTWAGTQFTLGQEVLGSGKEAGVGNRAFQTPLATKHAFQGWADVFLTTPADGLRDAYLLASRPVAGGKLQVAYHDFRSDRGDRRFGTEWDVAYSRAIPAAKGWLATLKYAAYDSAHASGTVDTDKLWVQVQYTR
ncbi:hypothetical protein J2X02_000919 [Pseudoxanthomonas japonensis]|uniref:hypothetical protein n=1 Tax=Pseudoxanthomonas japonensis TaxID=69284 RepID=UPI00285D6BB9|nr:hypothetical protein [Pseudoxanthomonas japonensis]MDR7068102.1 hypothetical protein [Pseudoxanthomonas japonensis]